MVLNKKAISAIISVVLLILVTSVLVAGFFSWSKASTRDKLDISKDQLQSISNSECRQYDLVIQSCSLDYDTGKVTLLLRNPTPVDFKDLTLTLQGKSQGSNDVLKVFGKFDSSVNAGEIKYLSTDNNFTFTTNDVNVSASKIIDPLNLKSFTLTTSTCPKRIIDLKRCAVNLPAFETLILSPSNAESNRVDTSINFNSSSIYNDGTVSCEWYQTIESGSQVRMNPLNTDCNTSYSFTTAGTYDVLLVATDDSNTSSNQITLALWDAFSGGITEPVDSTKYNINKTITLKSLFDSNMSTVSCEWSHKESGLSIYTPFSTDCNTSLVLDQINTFTIKLDSNDTGDSSLLSETIDLNILDNLSSTITSLSRSIWNNNESISFTGTYDNNVSTVSCEWVSSLSDVNTTRGTDCSSLNYTFSSTGAYTVYFKVTDSGTSDVATSSVDFNVYNPLTGTTSSPASSSVYNLSESITFTVSPSYNLGTVTYQWEYNRDSLGWTNFGTNSASISAGFATGGTYQFRVSLTDAGRVSPINQVYSNTITGVIISNPLAVSITSPTTGTQYDTDATINFASSVSYAISGVSTYTWEYSTDQSSWVVFGTSSSTASTSFSSSGTEYIRLSVQDGASRTATSSTISLSILAPPLINITSFSNLTGWTLVGGTVLVSGGYAYKNPWYNPASFLSQGSTTQGNVVIEGIISSGNDNKSRTGFIFNYGSSSATYLCYLDNDYERDGLSLYYNTTLLDSDICNRCVDSSQYNIKIEAFGSSKM